MPVFNQGHDIEMGIYTIHLADSISDKNLTVALDNQAIQLAFENYFSPSDLQQTLIQERMFDEEGDNFIDHVVVTSEFICSVAVASGTSVSEALDDGHKEAKAQAESLGVEHASGLFGVLADSPIEDIFFPDTYGVMKFLEQGMELVNNPIFGYPDEMKMLKGGVPVMLSRHEGFEYPGVYARDYHRTLHDDTVYLVCPASDLPIDADLIVTEALFWIRDHFKEHPEILAKYFTEATKQTTDASSVSEDIDNYLETVWDLYQDDFKDYVEDLWNGGAIEVLRSRVPIDGMELIPEVVLE